MSLKNISQEVLNLRWDGVDFELKPGQTARFTNPTVEMHFKHKYPDRLEHKLEAATEVKPAVVVEEGSTVSPPPPNPEGVPTGSGPDAEPSGDFVCSVAGCGFSAKTEKGLLSHEKKAHGIG
jgi:hypothetical protein